MSFKDLGLSAELLRAVSEQGYSEPTPIQAKAIPVILDGRDVMASAQTGTGKTAGFTLPLLQRLAATRSGGRRAPRALVLAPTRELAAQVGDSVATYGAHLPLSSTIVFGGVGFAPQAKALRKGTDILIATPGRLLDHVAQKTVDLSGIEILVLDEADRMLDMGFIPDIKRILALLPENDERQNLLFSATFSAEITALADRLLQQPERIEVAHRNTAAEQVEQVVHPVEKARKRELLSHMIGAGNWRQVLVFARTRHGADRLARHLNRDGLKSAALHGDKSQAQRTRALNDFKAGRVRVLVATDIAARGLDIDQLPHVVNFELPNVPEDYVHRIGRTGRAGREGEATSLVCPEEYKLLRDIERLLRRPVPIKVLADYAPDEAYQAEAPRRGGNGGGRARAGNRQERPDGRRRKRKASGSGRGRSGSGARSKNGHGGATGQARSSEPNGNVALPPAAEGRPEVNGNVAAPQNRRPAGKPSQKSGGNRSRRKAGEARHDGQHRPARPGQGRKQGGRKQAAARP